MYLTFMILTGINLLVYFYAFLKDLQMIIETKAFKKAFEAGKKIGKDIEKTYEEKKETTNKGAYVAGVIIALILLFVVYGAIIYVPIWIGLRYGVNNAIATYLVFLLFTTSLRLYKYGMKPTY